MLFLKYTGSLDRHFRFDKVKTKQYGEKNLRNANKKPSFDSNSAIYFNLAGTFFY
jgi:hypothetical protein